jgi:eukaryotic-like serine/threonine-protein kinase
MPSLTRDTLCGEALFILRNLWENQRMGRSNKLGEVKSTLEPAVSLEFDTYFFFLRKFHYIAMDREAQLRLTDEGAQVVEAQTLDRFTEEVGTFFADHFLLGDEGTQLGEVEINEAPSNAPPVPVTDFNFEESVAPPRKKTPSSFEDATPARAEVPDLRGGAFPPPPSPSPAAFNTAKGTDLDQRYVKFDSIGSGPLGTVFKGRHNALGLEVCVKELKDIFGYFSFLQRGEVVKRLKKELCAQAQVRHPGVVAVLDQNTEVARPYFVMELLGGSLREQLDPVVDKGLPWSQALRYFLQMVYALRAAHRCGLYHHNIKPENVLFDGWGNTRLGDFGLSRVIEVDASKGMPQVIVGTGGMAYMAPELVSRGKDPAASADVYAVGILLYEMLTGQLPGRRSPLPSEVNSEIPAKLDPIFDKMTQDRREARYPDLDAVLDDFYDAFSEGEFLARGDLVLWSGQ